tara:strand:- start:416 stop:889 length:474 start_codon:yes stop_codon:yes gene_type:complete
MKIFISFLGLLCALIFVTSTNALEKGKWTFIKGDEYCYIGSRAEKTDLPDSKKRGDYYILVYKYKGNPDTIIQIEAGYNYKLDTNIIVNIDKGEYLFYTTEDVPDSAWTDNDNKVIFAMKKGLVLIVTGTSSRGTITNDTYTLKGFTSAYNNLVEDC